MRTHVEHWTGATPGYGAALPSGAYAILTPGSHLATHDGPLGLPGENVGYLDVTERLGELLVTGAGMLSDTAYLSLGEAWQTIRRPAYGMDPCLFVPALDELWVAIDGFRALRLRLGDGAVLEVSCETGSQGFGYAKADGTVVLGHQVYIDIDRGLCGFTDFGDVAIGQGVEDGAVVRFADDGVLRLLCPGTARNIRVKRDGDAFAVTVVDYTAHTTTIYWLTLAELRALPPVTAGDVISTPLPETPKPTPKPETPMDLQRDIETILREVNSEPAWELRLERDSAATTARSIRFLEEVVRRCHARGLKVVGLLWKPGRGINADNLTVKQGGTILHYDVISGADGLGANDEHSRTPTLAWSDNGPIQSGWEQRFPIGGSDPGDEDEPKPEPVPNPGPSLPNPGRTQLDRIEAKLDRLLAALRGV